MRESNPLAVGLDDAGRQGPLEPVGLVSSAQSGCRGFYTLNGWLRERGDDQSRLACRAGQLLETVAHELAEALRDRKGLAGGERDLAARQRACNLEREEGIARRHQVHLDKRRAR